MRARDYAYFDGPTPTGLAHRGGAAYHPNLGIENTIAAFRQAVDMGYRYLETDVHATRDGIVVAFHDDHLDRVTDTAGRIADQPYAAVRGALIGGREAVPTLAELLEEFPETRVNIDIKADQALGPTLELIRRMGVIDRVCIGSFSERRLRAARRALGPRLATSAGQVGVGALRLAPQPLSRLLHTPAPALQIPMSTRSGVGSSRSRRGRWSRSPTGSASMCTCGSTRGPPRMPPRCTGCWTSASTGSSPTTSTSCVTCSPSGARPCDLHRCGS